MWKNRAIGEAGRQAEFERPHQPACDKVVGDRRVAAKHDALALDCRSNRVIGRRKRWATVRVDIVDPGAVQPYGPIDRENVIEKIEALNDHANSPLFSDAEKVAPIMRQTSRSFGLAGDTQVRHADAAGVQRCLKLASADVESEAAIVAAEAEFDRLANFPPIRRLAIVDIEQTGRTIIGRAEHDRRQPVLVFDRNDRAGAGEER